MANDNQDYQVIIVGGGPAGIATSLSLSSRGITNCVIEAKSLPTAKTGEAIPPNAKPLLNKLGVKHLLDHPEHTIYYGNKSCWGTDELEQKEFITGIHGHGYLLNRLYFESQLRQYLTDRSNNLKAGYQLKKVIRTADGIEVCVDDGTQTIWMKASYIVDATGRKASVCRQLGESKIQIDSQFAITFSINLKEPISHQITIEATENGWWYAAPQQGTKLILMFFTLSELIPHKTQMKSFVLSELENSLHISQLINGGDLEFENTKIKPTGTSRLEVPYGENWIAVGDAAFSYDPISSYGITSALASGYYAGHALASALSNKKDAMLSYRYVVESAFQAYMEKLEYQYAQENRWENSLYWTKRFSHMV